MAAVETLTIAFLICQANSQAHGFRSIPAPQGCETATPCCTDIYQPMGIQTAPNLVFQSQPISNTVPLNQPCLNFPALPCFQNQAQINKPVKNTVLPAQPIVNNILPKSTNVTPPINQNTQLTPSVTANPTPNTPVVTVVDNTLANSLANALQLLILSNLLQNSETSNLPQSVPCINNNEIVPSDFTSPSTFCDNISNMLSIPEPVPSGPGPVFSCPEPVYSCQKSVVSCPEPVVFQSYPTNFGGSFPVTDNFGFQCGPNQVFSETPTQYITQVVPVCNEPVVQIPAVAEIPSMALELPFPESIPAQLTCNFGFLPSNEPCVTFNVEPLPCKNMFGNFAQ